MQVEEYRRSIEWLERGWVELTRHPQTPLARDGVLHSFEVTHNLSEALLRQSLMKVADALDAGLLSSRELLRYAGEEGLAICSSSTWLGYGLALEHANDTFGGSFAADVFPFVPRYITELRAFAMRLERRLV